MIETFWIEIGDCWCWL